MEALLSAPSPEPQNPITDPANSELNYQSDEDVKDETMTKKTEQSNSEKRKLKGKKKEINMNNDEASSSSCSISSISNSNSTRRVSRVVAHRLRNPTVRLGMARRSVGERQAEALALPLGMSFAALANLVLQRKNAACQNIYLDDLATFSATAVTETFASVYGTKLGSFATTFEKSFNHTLRILKYTNESAKSHQLNNDDDIGRCNLDSSSTIDGYWETELSAKDTSSAYEVIQGSAIATSSMNELLLHEESRQLCRVPPRSSAMSFIKIAQEANDLKKEELGLKKRKIILKEVGLLLKKESNDQEKRKLEMAASEAAFREEKHKTELEDKRKAEMVTRITDCLGVSVFIMLAAMSIGAYNFSLKRIEEATSVCESSEEKSSSWWPPQHVSALNSEFNNMICRFRVWVQFCFGIIMFAVFTYIITQRSSGRKPNMPISFVVVVLGLFCGLAVMVCVNTLGGNGNLWIILWEVFCLFHLVANLFTLPLYGLMHGPINVTQGTKSSRYNTLFPYWARRNVLYVMFIFVLPVITGLLPFATFGEWRDLFMDNFFGYSKV